VSPFCTRLTTLTQEEADRGVPFAEACGILRKKYESRDRVWASFGDFDRKHFDHQCRAWDVPYPFGPRHLNVKTLFALIHGLPAEVGMDGALRKAGLPLEGTHHRAGDDAWNIAGLLSDLLLRARRPAS
jgi:inhibitor of KinA sporulation pathway (predicted exonuclease)